MQSCIKALFLLVFAVNLQASPILDTAKQYIGLHEKYNNIKLIKSLDLKINPYLTPWCAAFVNSILKKNNIKGTKSNLARSFLRFGVKTNSPKKGDIVILKRGKSSWEGHVGFFVKQTKTHVYLLGGNQGNKVSIKAYSKHRLLGYRTYEN